MPKQRKTPALSPSRKRPVFAGRFFMHKFSLTL
jgi:hypothetical protein